MVRSMVRNMIRHMVGGMIRPVIGAVVVAVTVMAVVIVAAERRPNQLAVCEAVLIGGLVGGTLGWYGFQGFFHMSPPAHGGGKNTTTPKPWIVGLEGNL